jgi:hypothetical protein
MERLMTMTLSLSKVRRRLLSSTFSRVSPAMAETMEIMLDVEQMGMLLSSLEEVRSGQVVGFAEAFGDL